MDQRALKARFKAPSGLDANTVGRGMNRAFSAYGLAFYEFLGRCPRLGVEGAPLALKGRMRLERRPGVGAHRPFGGQFSLQERASFGTFGDVRTVLVLGIWLTAATVAFAQKQEPGFIERLLKPNTALASSAQNKKFTNMRTTTLEKPAETHSFYAPSRTATKTFPEERAFNSRQFAARHFRAGDSSANIATRSQLTKSDTLIATPAATAGARVAPESIETAPVREYAGNRPFLDKGKSQKSLSAQNSPLTIEQVRELLNKSK